MHADTLAVPQAATPPTAARATGLTGFPRRATFWKLDFVANGTLFLITHTVPSFVLVGVVLSLVLG
jgi:hypothetical protein